MSLGDAGTQGVLYTIFQKCKWKMCLFYLSPLVFHHPIHYNFWQEKKKKPQGYKIFKEVFWILFYFFGCDIHFLKNYSHPVGVKCFHCGFDLQFSKDVGHIFMCLLDIYISSLKTCLIKSFAILNAFYLSLLGGKSSLYILDTSSISYIWFASIFSYPMSCLSNLPMASFEACC